MIRIFEKMLNPWKRRILLMIGRAILLASTDQGGRLTVKLEALAGEVHAGVEVFQNYGFASRPLKGAEQVIAAVGGERGHSIVIASEDRRHRPELVGGESVIYDDQGQYVRIFRDRIEVKAAKVLVLSDDVHLGAEGGKPVARIGDKVQVGGGSSAGLWPIVEGSSKVGAA